MCWAPHSFPPEHPDSFSVAPRPTGLWVYLQNAWQLWWGANCQGGDETLPCPYTPSCVTLALLLGSLPCSPCTSLRGDVVEPPLSWASLQPKQGCPQRPLWTGWPHSAVWFGKASSQRKEVWWVATSTKHQVALLFRQMLSLRRCKGLGWIFLTEDGKDITWFHNESLKLEKGNSPGKSEGVIKRT